MTTTIQIDEDTRDALNELKIHSRETYNDVLQRVLEDFLDLSYQTKREIRKAIEEIDKGMYKSLSEVRRELGLM